MDGGKFYCYLLVSDKRTYIGATVDPDRRLEQHNGVKSGGARATRGKAWDRICYVSGFPDWNAALQFEWSWKHVSRRQHGVGNKLDGLIALIERGRSSSTSMPFILWGNHLCIHFTLHDTLFFRKIDKCNLNLTRCACLNTTSFPKTFCFFPFQMSVSEVSSNSISQLASMVEALRAEVTQLKARMDTALAMAPAADAPKKQRGRKPNAAKVTATEIVVEAPDTAAAAVAVAVAPVTPVNRIQADTIDAPKKGRKPAAKKADATEAADATVATVAKATAAPKRGPKAKAAAAASPAADLTVALEAVADVPAKVVKKRGPKAKPTETTA
jgi:predicted GIY-YIG superfamily endonuclease